MKVNGKDMQTIWFDEISNTVKIIDQTQLPFKLKIRELNNLSDSIDAIKNMQVRGAPLIGVTAAYGMYLASKESNSLDFLKISANKLKSSRPTAINLAWAVDKILVQVQSKKVNNIGSLKNFLLKDLSMKSNRNKKLKKRINTMGQSVLRNIDLEIKKFILNHK